jgi:hypothetical protein
MVLGQSEWRHYEYDYGDASQKTFKIIMKHLPFNA